MKHLLLIAKQNKAEFRENQLPIRMKFVLLSKNQ